MSGISPVSSVVKFPSAVLQLPKITSTHERDHGGLLLFPWEETMDKFFIFS